MSQADRMRRLVFELSRDEPDGLHRSLAELDMIEEPPAALDARVLGASRSRAQAVVSGLGQALLQADSEGLGKAVASLGLLEEPPAALDHAVIAAARAAASSSTTGARPRQAVGAGRYALAASLLLVLGGLRDLLRDHVFAVVTTMSLAAALALIISAERAAEERRVVAAVPAGAQPEQWAHVEEAMVPRGGPEVAELFRSGTATAAERPIAEAMGSGRIGRLLADGTLEIIPHAGSVAVRAEQIEAVGGLDQEAAVRVVSAALEHIASCAPAVGTRATDAGWKLQIGRDDAKVQLVSASPAVPPALDRCLRDALGRSPWSAPPAGRASFTLRFGRP